MFIFATYYSGKATHELNVNKEMGLKDSNMYKKKIYNTVIRGVVLVLFYLYPLAGLCQTGAETVNTLVKMGFENVGWSDTENERIYVMENSSYCLNGVGISKAVDIIQKMGLSETKPCRIIFLNNNIPEISLYFQPNIKDSTMTVGSDDWNVSYNLGKEWKQAIKGKKKNSSLFKVDIVVYPELYFKNLIITQIYQVLVNFSPAIEVSLWKGMKFAAQMVVPVYNDGYPYLYDKVHPQFLSLSQTVRFPSNIWATLSAGNFSNDRYGLDLKLVHHFRNERFSAEGRIGYTGSGFWNGFTYHYGTKMRLTWSLGGSFYWPKYNLETTLRYAQFILGEKGARIDVIRHFRYASVGFYAMKAEGAKSNGGFRFQIALPPYKYKRKGYIPRITTSKNFGIAYNAGNEQYYYKEYKTMPGDNIMQNNSFNPYFIKSELLNY